MSNWSIFFVLKIYLSIKLLSQEVIILNNNFILEWNENKDEILHLTNANLLCKRNTIIDYIKDNYENIFLYMRDIDSECMKNELEIFSRDFCINNKLFNEIKDDFSGYYNNIIDISCIWVYIYYKNNNKKREIMIRIFLSKIKDENIKATEFKGKFKCNYWYSNYKYDFS